MYPDLFANLEWHGEFQDDPRIDALWSDFNKLQSNGELKITNEGNVHAPTDSLHDHEFWMHTKEESET